MGQPLKVHYPHDFSSNSLSVSKYLLPRPILLQFLIDFSRAQVSRPHDFIPYVQPPFHPPFYNLNLISNHSHTMQLRGHHGREEQSHANRRSSKLSSNRFRHRQAPCSILVGLFQRAPPAKDARCGRHDSLPKTRENYRVVWTAAASRYVSRAAAGEEEIVFLFGR